MSSRVSSVHTNQLHAGGRPSTWLQVRKFARLDIDPASITWRRVIDTNDRWVSHWQEDELNMRRQQTVSRCQGKFQQQERQQGRQPGPELRLGGLRE
jgi:formyltetrahydrofolate synthetase